MIQVYTGNGKGKTTAALGLALRAAGAGLKVYIAQFIKGKICSEHHALKKIKNIKVEQFGGSCFIRNRPSLKDRLLANEGLKRVKEIITMKIYDIVIIDEINIALKLKLIKLQDVIKLIKDVPCKTE
ncbi:MAG: cob(I)yrinic acid a,c-diamide adenosyltransferase, partial [Candidatus Omnitrophota bacterium]